MTARRYYRQERVVAALAWSPVAPGGSVTEGEYVVRGYSIACTDDVVFEVYEELHHDRVTGYSHSTSFTSEEFGRLGTVLSRRLPPEIDALPYGEARTAACNARRAKLEATCDEIIRTAFPEIAEAGVLSTRGGHGSCRLDYANGLAPVRP